MREEREWGRLRLEGGMKGEWDTEMDQRVRFVDSDSDSEKRDRVEKWEVGESLRKRCCEEGEGVGIGKGSRNRMELDSEGSCGRKEEIAERKLEREDVDS